MEKIIIHSLKVSERFSSKIELIETILHQAIYNFRDLVIEFEQMHMQTESVKNQITSQNEKCESKTCSAAKELKKVIQTKDNIIQLVASALTKLDETKNFSVLTKAFQILFGEAKSDNAKVVTEDVNSNDIDIQKVSIINNSNKQSEVPKAQDMSIQEQEDSVSEIECTPTGRRSPIIQSKKLKSSTPNNTVLRDKKKCPENWLTPEKKTFKVETPTPTKGKGSGRWRQKRINLVKLKTSNVVDLTTSPQFSAGRGSQEELTKNIKQEVIENDDTILPSPTSGSIFNPIYKSIAKESPQKFKKPLSLIRSKDEKTLELDKNGLDNVTNVSELEESVNLLKEYNDGNISPKECKTEKKSPNHGNESISLLQQVNNIESNTEKEPTSPTKRPLVENINFGNVECDIESSMSILRRDVKITKMDAFDENIKRSKSEILEPLYKEPTVRKKAEKRALPGWSCDECKNFYGELYKDNPEMLGKKMDQCSKHRGHNNPVRPKTPPGFWNPRWDVPENTEEFNRQNNAV